MNIFYDNGCSDFIVSSKGVQLLGSSAYKFDNQPILLKGVGESIISSLGSYHVSLPLYNGEIVTLSGLCLKEVTSTFPIFPLKEVEEDIIRDYQSTGGKQPLPKLPPCVGGEIHLMI